MIRLIESSGSKKATGRSDSTGSKRLHESVDWFNKNILKLLNLFSYFIGVEMTDFCAQILQIKLHQASHRLREPATLLAPPPGPRLLIHCNGWFYLIFFNFKRVFVSVLIPTSGFPRVLVLMGKRLVLGVLDQDVLMALGGWWNPVLGPCCRGSGPPAPVFPPLFIPLAASAALLISPGVQRWASSALGIQKRREVWRLLPFFSSFFSSFNLTGSNSVVVFVRPNQTDSQSMFLFVDNN